MSWDFTCQSCGQVTQEDDDNKGVGSCGHRDCSAFGQTKRVDGAALSPQVEVKQTGKTIKIEITVSL